MQVRLWTPKANANNRFLSVYMYIHEKGAAMRKRNNMQSSSHRLPFPFPSLRQRLVMEIHSPSSGRILSKLGCLLKGLFADLFSKWPNPQSSRPIWVPRNWLGAGKWFLSSCVLWMGWISWISYILPPQIPVDILSCDSRAICWWFRISV